MFCKLGATGPDSQLSWIVMVFCVILSCLSSAMFRSAGFFYVAVIENYHVSRQVAAWPISINVCVSQFTAILGGVLCQYFSHRILAVCGAIICGSSILAASAANSVTSLAVTLGALCGFGGGIVFTMVNVSLPHYFVKYKAVAFGFVYGGATIASFIFPPLLHALEQAFSFSKALFIFGIILSSMALFSLVLIEPPWKQNGESDASKAKQDDLTASNKECDVKLISWQKRLLILKRPMFYLLAASYTLFHYGFDTFMTTIVDFAQDRGATVQQGINILPIFSLSDLAGRILFPIAADYGLLSRTTLIAISYFFAGVCMICMPETYDYTTLVVVVGFLGVFIGAIASLFACLITDYLGADNAALSYGFITSLNGIVYVTKPFFFGYFRDVMQSYDNAWRICSVLLLSLSVAWCLAMIRNRLQKRNSVTIVK